MGNGFLDDCPDLEINPRPRKKRKKKPEPPTDPDSIIVRYVRVRCPKCGSYKVPVYNSDHLPIRYHKCADCGFLFKSVEETNS